MYIFKKKRSRVLVNSSVNKPNTNIQFMKDKNNILIKWCIHKPEFATKYAKSYIIVIHPKTISRFRCILQILFLVIYITK